MPNRVWLEWIAFYGLEPFGEDDLKKAKSADQRAALQAANIRNLFRKKGGRASKIKDFMPKRKHRQSPAQMWNIIMEHKERAG